MEKIIQKAIEGGWQPKEFTKNWVLNVGNRTFLLDSPFDDPLFWQALGKTQDDWCSGEVSQGDGTCMDCSFPHCHSNWKEFALTFHEINLTQGFDSAVVWLSDLVDKS